MQPVKLAEKELTSGVMVNVTGWGAVKVSSQRIDSLSERCGKLIVLGKLSQSLERDLKMRAIANLILSRIKSEPLHSVLQYANKKINIYDLY